VTQAHQPRCLTQRQDLAEEPSKDGAKAPAKSSDGVEVWPGHGGEVHDSDIMAAGRFQPSRGIDAAAGSVEQEPNPRVRVIGRAAALGAVGSVNGSQIKLADRPADDVHRVVRADEIEQRLGQQKGLVWGVGMVRAHDQ
jgi:hypothetical protein